MPDDTMKLQHGFSATDLLVAVTVLLLMAAVAVPRFSAINSDSRTSAVRSLAANVESSAQLTHRVWRSAGQTGFLNIEGNLVEMRYGYPTGQSIRKVVIERDNFMFSDGQWAHREMDNDPGCSVLYIPPSEATPGVQVISYTDGC
jgi:Tfp pilus assembly protein FimT